MFAAAALLPSELKAIGPCNKKRLHFWTVLAISQGLYHVMCLILLSVKINFAKTLLHNGRKDFHLQLQLEAKPVFQ